jgi:hypothetical protein
MTRVARLLLVLLALAPLSGWAADAHDCEHAGEKKVASPDGRWVATVQEEVCAIGNRTGAGIMVDLALASDASHAKRVFNMRVPRSRDLWPRVIWKGPATMELWAPNRAEILAQESQFEGVQIQLRYCGDNPAERAQVGEYQAALKRWMKDTTDWAQKRKQDPAFNEPRPKRPTEPTYSSDSCAGVGDS